MKIRALIADDEPLARQGVRQLLVDHGDVEIVGEARDGREVAERLRSLSPDLVFLDVQMPELDGFEALAAANPLGSTVIVFVTAYDAFALRAFDAEALDYLVKPLNASRFGEMMDRVRRRIREARHSSDARPPDALDAASEQAAARKRRLKISTRTGERLIDPDDIVWIEAFDYYVVIHVAGRRLLMRASLASLETRLDGGQFLRTHRGALVNLAHVREVHPDHLTLSDGARAKLGRRRRRDLMQGLERLHG